MDEEAALAFYKPAHSYLSKDQPFLIGGPQPVQTLVTEQLQAALPTSPWEKGSDSLGKVVGTASAQGFHLSCPL